MELVVAVVVEDRGEALALAVEIGYGELALLARRGRTERIMALEHTQRTGVTDVVREIAYVVRFTRMEGVGGSKMLATCACLQVDGGVHVA